MNSLVFREALLELEEYENNLVADFREHAFFKNISLLNDDMFNSCLIQRRYISHLFTPVYDLAIDHLDDEECKNIARKILGEEYPDNKPSHRELLMIDMMKIGINREKILFTPLSEATKKLISASLALLFKKDCNANHHQIRILTVLRFWGEVLVAIEYQSFWEVLKKRGLSSEEGENKSIFYEPHIVHDSKKKSFTDNDYLMFFNHSDRLTIQLKKHLNSIDDFDFCKKLSNEVLSIKSEFYNQFIEQKKC
jgi:hypothetical protein